MEIKIEEILDININNKFQIPLEEIVLISPEEVEKILDEIKDI
jgi:hypothetical protein